MVISEHICSVLNLLALLSLHAMSNQKKSNVNSIVSRGVKTSAIPFLVKNNSDSIQIPKIYETVSLLSVHTNELNDNIRWFDDNLTRQDKSEITTQELSTFEVFVIPGNNSSFDRMEFSPRNSQNNLIDKMKKVKSMGLIPYHTIAKGNRTKNPEKIGLYRKISFSIELELGE